MTKSLLQHGMATLFSLELTLWSQTRFKANFFLFSIMKLSPSSFVYLDFPLSMDSHLFRDS